MAGKHNTVSCTNCKTTFQRPPSAQKKSKHLFCNRKCAYIFRTGKPAKHTRKPVAERFWSKVDKRGPDDCWVWLGSIRKDGHGRFGLDYKIAVAHRVAYELTYGPIPEGLLVRHAVCGNAPCCNPKHLLTGTVLDNASDTVRHGHSLKGERHPFAKLNEEQVHEIREWLNAGATQAAVASIFNVSQGTINLIVKGAIWQHI